MNTNTLYIQLRGSFEQESYISSREGGGEKHFTYYVEKNSDPLKQIKELIALLDGYILDEMHIDDMALEELSDEALEYVIREHTHV